MSRYSRLPVALVALFFLAACATTEAGEPDRRTIDGVPVPFGNGSARTFVVMEAGVPVEVGVALTESALDGQPGPHDAGGIHVHGHTTFETVLELPADNPTPYRHVLLNWNPGGHEPPGIYDLPHLDFHFYTIDNHRRLAIDERDPDFQAQAERVPDPALIPAGYILPAPLAFPRMGVHWVDPASPELNGKTFTHTFIYGSWNGELIFAEPMITKQFLETRTEASATLPLPAAYPQPGYYPTGYAIRWDADAREHRIVLTGLVGRD